jgi:hypothetical protein
MRVYDLDGAHGDGTRRKQQHSKYFTTRHRKQIQCTETMTWLANTFATEIGSLCWYLRLDLHSPQDIPWSVFSSHHHGEMAAQCHLRWYHHQHLLRHHLLRLMHLWLRRSLELPPSYQLTAVHLYQTCRHPCFICFHWL